MLKSYGVGWWGGGGGGGPCDFGVSPSPFELDFGTLDFGTSDSGLTILFRNERAFKKKFPVPTKTLIHQSINWESKEELQVDIALFLKTSLPCPVSCRLLIWFTCDLDQ